MKTFKKVLILIFFFIIMAAWGLGSGWFIGNLLNNYIDETILGCGWLHNATNITFRVLGTLLGIVAFLPSIALDFDHPIDFLWALLLFVSVPIILAVLAALIVLIFFLLDWVCQGISNFFDSPEGAAVGKFFGFVGIGLGLLFIIGFIVSLLDDPTEIIAIIFRR